MEAEAPSSGSGANTSSHSPLLPASGSVSASTPTAKTAAPAPIHIQLGRLRFAESRGVGSNLMVLAELGPGLDGRAFRVASPRKTNSPSPRRPICGVWVFLKWELTVSVTLG